MGRRAGGNCLVEGSVKGTVILLLLLLLLLLLSRAPFRGATIENRTRVGIPGGLKKFPLVAVQSRAPLYIKKYVAWIPGGLFDQT